MIYTFFFFSCRRDIISKHFTEVWKESDCNKMCDRCYHKDRVHPPSCDLTKHCNDLQRIIKSATNMDIKLTANKLIDAWFHKGSSNARVLDISPPAIERYYAEQMVAFLIISGYLKEDFHFTAYSTISYIKCGTQKPQKNTPITFNGARVLNLPNHNHLWDNLDAPLNNVAASSSIKTAEIIETPKTKKSRIRHETLTTTSDEDVKKIRKKRHSESSKGNLLSPSSSVERKKSKRRTLESASIERISSSVSKMVTEIVAKEAKRQKLLQNSSNSICNDSDGDDVVLIEDDEDIISIDD